MARIFVRQGGGSAARVDFSALWPRGTPFLDHNTPLVQMGQKFGDGSAAVGQMLVMDPGGDIPDPGYRLAAHATVELTEDASGTDYTIAYMRVAPQEAGRRELYVPGDEIEHQVTLHDCNIDLRGIPTREEWARGAETDMQRLQALETSKLNGASSTATIHRATTDIHVAAVSSGHLVDNSAPVDLDAHRYPAGTNPVDVIADCASQASKIFGVVLHHEDGVGTHRCLLYINELDHSTFTSPIKISDDPADIDPDHPTAPVFAPNWLRGKGRIVDNDFVISGIINIWGGTNDDPRFVYLDNGEADEDWETWVDVHNDGDSETETQATRRATSILNARELQHITGRVSILLKTDQLHLITAGQSIQIKSVVYPGGEAGVYKDRRVVECIYEPAADGLWWAHLQMDRPMRLGIPNPGAGQPKSTSPKPAPQCDDSEDTLIVASDSDWPSHFDTAGEGHGEAWAEAFNTAGVSHKTGSSTASFTDTHTLWNGEFTPSTVYRLEVSMASKYSQGGGASDDFTLDFYDDAGDSNIVLSINLPVSLLAKTGATFTYEFTAPTYHHVHYTTPSFPHYYTVGVYEPASEDPDPDCIDYVSDEDPHSPFFMPADEVIARDNQLQDAITDLSKAHVESDTDPTATDDDYPIGAVWVDTTTNTAFVLVDDTSGAAVWIEVNLLSGSVGEGAYAETIGDGSNTSYQVTHDLGTTDVIVQLWDVSGADPVEATGDASSITVDDADNVTIVFGSAPGTDDYRVVILASGSGHFSGAMAYRNGADATQNALTNTNTAAELDAVDYDTDGYWDAGNPTRLTVPADGVYMFHAETRMDGEASFDDASGGNFRFARFRINGDPGSDNVNWFGGSHHRAIGQAGTHLAATGMAVLAAGDYVEFMVYQNSGETLTFPHTTLVGGGDHRTVVFVTRLRGGTAAAGGGGGGLEDGRWVPVSIDPSGDEAWEILFDDDGSVVMMEVYD